MMNDVVEEIRSLLASAMGSRCTTYYAGDVGMPAKNYMPCLMVCEASTEQSRTSTAKDQYRFGIRIIVVTDVVKALDVAGVTDSILKSRQTLRKIMEEADTDGAPKADTVLGCLMKQANIRGTNFVYNLNPRINYEVEPIPGFFYVAAEIRLEFVTDLITRKA